MVLTNIAVLKNLELHAHGTSNAHFTNHPITHNEGTRMISEAEKTVLAKNQLDESQYLIKRIRFAAAQKTTWEQLIQLTQEDREIAKTMGLKIGDFIEGKLEDLALQVINS